MNKKEKEEFRKKVKETTEKEIIRDALRARKFSGTETLAQSIDLNDFALRMRKMRFDATIPIRCDGRAVN